MIKKSKCLSYTGVNCLFVEMPKIGKPCEFFSVSLWRKLRELKLIYLVGVRGVINRPLFE